MNVNKTTNKFNFKKFKKQAGMTLLELIASLSVIAVVVVGALALYQSATSSQQTTQITQDLVALRAAVKQMWQGQGSYGAAGTNLNSVLVASKKVPTTIRVDATATPPTMTHAANGAVTITSQLTNFDIALGNIDTDLCIPLLTGSQGWVSVTVAGASAITAFPVAPATAVTACGTGIKTVTFRGN